LYRHVVVAVCLAAREAVQGALGTQHGVCWQHIDNAVPVLKSDVKYTAPLWKGRAEPGVAEVHLG
jgi:hypothetical protein